MSQLFYASVPNLGQGDLVAFRDAAVTYAACRRHGGRLFWQASPEAERLLSWLGLEGEVGPPEGLAYLDAGRTLPDSVTTRPLLSGESLSELSLDELRQSGVVAEAVFAALIRSSYGPDGLDYFPTSSELGFYFEDSLLLQDRLRWDDEDLQDCQAFFMEELMPSELLEKSLASLPWEVGEALRHPAERFAEELHGVTFLVATGLENLRPLAELLQALLGKAASVDGLGELLQAVGDSWTPQAWRLAWAAQPEGLRAQMAETLCPGFIEQAEAILLSAGPALLSWRNEALQGVSS